MYVRMYYQTKEHKTYVTVYFPTKAYIGSRSADLLSLTMNRRCDWSEDSIATIHSNCVIIVRHSTLLALKGSLYRKRDLGGVQMNFYHVQQARDKPFPFQEC